MCGRVESLLVIASACSGLMCILRYSRDVPDTLLSRHCGPGALYRPLKGCCPHFTELGPVPKQSALNSSAQLSSSQLLAAKGALGVGDEGLYRSI